MLYTGLSVTHSHTHTFAPQYYHSRRCQPHRVQCLAQGPQQQTRMERDLNCQPFGHSTTPCTSATSATLLNENFSQRLKAEKPQTKKRTYTTAKPFEISTQKCSPFFQCGLLQPPPALCLLFVPQVPRVRANTVAAIKVDLRGAKAVTSKKTKILIKPAAFIHLVQTDKPIYKPGQTGRGGERVAGVVWRRLCAGYSKCGGRVSPRAVRWISSLSVDTAHISCPALLTNSAAFAQIPT